MKDLALMESEEKGELVKPKVMIVELDNGELACLYDSDDIGIDVLRQAKKLIDSSIEIIERQEKGETCDA